MVWRVVRGDLLANVDDWIHQYPVHQFGGVWIHQSPVHQFGGVIKLFTSMPFELVNCGAAPQVCEL